MTLNDTYKKSHLVISNFERSRKKFELTEFQIIRYSKENDFPCDHQGKSAYLMLENCYFSINEIVLKKIFYILKLKLLETY